MPKRREEPPSVLPHLLTRPLTGPAIWFSRLLGVVLFAFGALLVFGAAGATLSTSSEQKMDSTSVLIYWLGLVPIGAFCCLLGARLALQLHNKYQSLLSPVSWITLGLVFSAVACWMAFTMLAAGNYSDVRPVGTAALFAVCCFGIASYLRAHRRRGQDETHDGTRTP